MASFPVLASASEGIPQYEPEIPEVPSEKAPKKNNNVKDPDAGSSRTNDPGSGGSETGEGEESSGGSGAGQGSGGGNGDGKSGANGGNGQGKSGDGSKSGQKTGLGEGTQVPVAQKQASDDSSSPLVPILIALAVLAAVSVAAVVIRNRRQGDGSDPSVSPKAS